MGSYLSDAALFLVDTIFGIYILLVLLRFLLQLVRADFYNPISQFIVRATNPPLVRLRRFIPGLLRIDLAALALLIVMEAIRISLTAMLLGHSPRLTGIIFLSLGELAKLAVYTIIFSIFIRALLSWFSNGSRHPISQLLDSFTDPILPARAADTSHDWRDRSFTTYSVYLDGTFPKLGIQPLIDLGQNIAF